MKIGFTGTRIGMSARQKRDLETMLTSLAGKATDFHHGDCVGADAEAHAIACRLFDITIHPPTNPVHRAYCDSDTVTLMPAKPYLDRNKDIVDATDVLIAAPKSEAEEMRSGTWSTVRYARRMGKPVIVLPRI